MEKIQDPTTREFPVATQGFRKRNVGASTVAVFTQGKSRN